MKRLAALILILLYLGTSTGTSLHFHYCMGEMAGTSLWGDNEKSCGNCGMNKDNATANGCCKDEIQWIQLDDDKKIPVSGLGFSKCSLESNAPDFLADENPIFVERATTIISNAPLRRAGLSAYLLNCVFRI